MPVAFDTILICDDSNMARKQVKRAIPDHWDADITFAKNGLEGLEAIRQGKGSLVFLDLTMPELDGYGVLEKVREEDLNCMVIVISADIQPDAKKRVCELGALDFIKKPVDADKMRDVLTQFGLFE